MLPWLKNHSETVNESSIRRSAFRNDRIRRQSARPTKKTAQNPSQSAGLLIFVPPKAPFVPRAIFHATCGPVHASVTAPVTSSTVPVAISPAAPENTLTVHLLSAYDACVVGFAG